MAFAWQIARTLNNSGSPFALSSYQVPIDLDSTWASDIFSKARSDGADIAIYDISGTTLQNFWLEYFTPGSSTGRLWLQVPSLGVGDSVTYQIQYADAGRSTSLGSFDNTFQKMQLSDIGSANVLALFRYDDGSGHNPTDATGNFTGSNTVIVDHTGGAASSVSWLGHAGGSWLGYNGSSSQNGVHFASGSAWHNDGTQGHNVTGLCDTWPAAGEFGIWFNPDSTINSSTTGFPHLFGKVNAGSSGSWDSALAAYFNTDGTLTVVQYYSTGNTTKTCSSQTTSWTGGVWHFAQIRWNLTTIELWVDGTLEAVIRTNQGSNNGQTGSGSANPFTIGAIGQYNASLEFQQVYPQQCFTGYLYQPYVLSLEPKYDYDVALLNWRKYQAGMGANSRLTKYASNPVLASTGSGWNGKLQIEPSQIVVSSTDFRLHCTGWSTGGVDSLGAFTSTDGKTFSAMSGTTPSTNPLISSGHGSNAIYDPDNSTYYWYYIKGSGASSALYYRTSSDGKDWSAAEAAVSGISVSGIGQSWCGSNLYNPWVYKDTNVSKWRMYIGGENSSNVWSTGLFESTNLTSGGTWTVPSGKTNPITITYRSTSSSVSLQWVKIMPDGSYVGIAHISSSGFGPTYGQHYYSSDGWTWSRFPAMFLGLEGENFSGTPADQLADFRAVDFNYNAFVNYDVDWNNSSWVGQNGRIDLATYPGSVQGLFTTFPTQSAATPQPIGGAVLLPTSVAVYCVF